MYHVCNCYVQHTCSCLCATYMQLFMCSIHAACKQLHTNCIHFFIYLYGMRVALSQFLCMQHACNMDVFCVQHACRYMCTCRCARMYAVYMPNMCIKVAEIYAVCMLYCACMYSAHLCALWHVSIFVYAAHMKT